jgi:hypothetical protein
MTFTDLVLIPVAAELHPGVRICAILGPRWLGVAIIPLMFYDLLLFVLAVHAYAHHVREHRADGFKDKETIFALLLRDNIWYFLMYVIFWKLVQSSHSLRLSRQCGVVVHIMRCDPSGISGELFDRVPTF